MGIDKAFASLSSGLLARKGAARPAMRPQGFGGGQGGLDDLGWNDMGQDAPVVPRELIDVRLPTSLSGPDAPLPPAEVPAVVHQQEEIAREFAPAMEAAPAPKSRPSRRKARPAPVRAQAEAVMRAALGSGRKAAFTLRLDAERHLRLRLACAVEHRSAQQLVIAALDRLLGDMPEVERLAASLPPVGKA